ncbi:type II toxin-antitoxin system YhaV family toxin [Bosea sp. RAF48]|uniref:type II toxin-antitoxin system YhaV family toxin n=1 Tax=Bosea sp. RAF48 TaxID=3237480 RepID=UPI003F916D70
MRTYGSKTDAYNVFKSMLDDGNPPDDWDALCTAASATAATNRLNRAAPSRE